jgi:hypothetical protein
MWALEEVSELLELQLLVLPDEMTLACAGVYRTPGPAVPAALHVGYLVFA